MTRPRLPWIVTLAAAAAAISLAAAPAVAASSGTFTPTGSMIFATTQGNATLLPDGQVLVAGGTSQSGTIALSSAELYSPATGTWSVTGSMHHGRTGCCLDAGAKPSATLLPNGDVLVTGRGQLFAERYHPATGQWSNASLGLGTCDAINECRLLSAATLLGTGNVLVAGGLVGIESDPQTTATAMLYHPGTNSWTSTGSMTTAREGQTATLLPDGHVLMAGEEIFDHPEPAVILASAELYTP